MANAPPDYFRTVLAGEGARLIGRPEVGPIGWGEQTYALAKYDTAVLVTVPHLSRYPIVGHPESQQAVDRIVSAAPGRSGDNREPPPAGAHA
jgi:hypothetical protein